MAKISLLPALNNPDGTELVPVVKGGKTMRASVAGLVAGAVAGTVDNLKVDAVAYIGRPGDVALVDGTPTGIGAVYWHDTVDDAGSVTAVDVFDRAAGTINLAVYRGPRNALVRVALSSFQTTGTRTSRRIALAESIAVRAGDFLAVQPTAGALVVAEVQSGDVGYTYSAPYLPETIALDAPTTNGQVQVRFVIAYRKQVVTADTFLASTAVKIVGPRAVATSSDVNPRGYVEWKTTGQPTGHTVRWGNYTASLDGKAQRMEFPNFSLAQPYAFIGNSLTDSTDVANRWSQILAARYGQLMISVARYSSDWRMVYRVGAKAIVLTLDGALPAAGTVAVSKINGAAIDGNNPAAFLTTGDASVVSGMAMSGYMTRNGVTRRATVSAPNGASFAYVVTQAPGQTAITFDGPVTFVPDFALSVPGRICVIWLGNNYFFSGVANAYGDYTNPQMWVDLKLIVAFLQARGCRVLLLPVIPSSNTVEGDNWLARGAGTPYTAMESANARTEAMFPGLVARYADGRPLLKFLQDRNDGSPEALDDVAKGFTPRNLRRRPDGSYDLLHMYGDGAGDRAVADFVDGALQTQALPNAVTQTTDFVITAIGAEGQLPDIAIARIGRDSVTDLADGIARVAAAVPTKADGIRSRNLFNKSTATIGFYLPQNGSVPVADVRYDYSAFIAVTPGQTYSGRGLNAGMRFVTVFDAAKIVMPAAGASDVSTFTVPPGAAFVRVTITHSDLAVFQFELGAVKTAYEPYDTVFINPAAIKARSVPGVVLQDKSVTPDQVSFLVPGKNLFNKAKVTSGYLPHDGSPVIADPNYDYSAPIAVTPGQTFYGRGLTHGMRFTTYFDAVGTFIAGGSGVEINTFTVPAGVGYVCVTIYHSDLATFQLEAGNAQTAYVPYGLSLSSDILASPLPAASVSTAMIAPGAVTVDKAAFFRLGKNLFNKTAATLGYFMSPITGDLTANVQYDLSDFIPVAASTTYWAQGSATRGARFVTFFTATKALITSNLTAEQTSFATPAGCAFMRASIYHVDLDSFQIEQGTVQTVYAPYQLAIDGGAVPIGFANLPAGAILSAYLADLGVTAGKLAPAAVTPGKTSFLVPGRNLFDKTKATLGFFRGHDGSTGSSATLSYSDYIPVTPGQQLISNSSMRFTTFYSANRAWITGGSSAGAGTTTITVPANVYFVIVTFTTSLLANFQLELGTASTAYEPFGFKFTADVIGGGGTSAAVNGWSNKTWATLGDSITAGYTWQVSVANSLGLLVTNFGIGGTKVSGPAGDANAMCQDTRINAIAETFDLITMMGGTNDWAQNVPLGPINSTDPTTFNGALNTFATKAFSRWPTKRIALATTPYGEIPDYTTRPGWTSPALNSLGLTTNDYAECIRQACNRLNLACIDVSRNAGWGTGNITPALGGSTTDRLHPAPGSPAALGIAAAKRGALRSIEPVVVSA